MKIIAPEIEVDLYNDGFEESDPIDRSQVGKQLSDLLEKTDDPTVITVDGSWGCGKSHFLKRWVGAHKNQNGGTAITVYFDAFANDYSDEPLIGLTGAISDRVSGASASSNTASLKSIKSAVLKIAKPFLRIGLATATAGATEGAGVVLDAAVDSTSNQLEKSIDDYWKREEGKQAAIQQFKSALTDMTNPNENNDSYQKLIIVVDELDRCRPDYALSLLEIIKHFFAVSNVHFVLGANLKELENSVKARYGQSVNSKLYLQKFITASINLPNKTDNHHSNLVEVVYFNIAAKEMDINSHLVRVIEIYLERILPNEMLTLRGIQKLLTQMALIPQVPKSFDNHTYGIQHFIAGLIILKVAFPDIYKKAASMELTMSDIVKCFLSTKSDDVTFERETEIIRQVWLSFLEPKNAESSDLWKGLFGTWGLEHPEATYNHILKDYIERINIGIGS